MTDTTYGLSDDVLERAAEAVFLARHPKSSPELWAHLDVEALRQEWVDAVRAALPVLAPALREATIRELIAHIDEMRHYVGAGEWSEARGFLAAQLPAADEQGAPR